MRTIVGCMCTIIDVGSDLWNVPMAAAWAPSSALALARILVALLSTRPNEDEGTRADAADGVLGEAGQ